MNILLIGNGGREHALGWKLKQSKQCSKLYFAPGNGGTATLGQNVDIHCDTVNTKLVDELDYFIRHNDIKLVVIGPEDPLSQGLSDKLAKAPSGKAGLIIFGPTADGAKLEADKAYCKQLLRAAAIPTAEAHICHQLDAAIAYAQSRQTPVVVKAAGLAKGKGVVVCDNADQAVDAVNMIMADRTFGDAGNTVVIEERLVGQEVSVLALVDGRNIYVLDPAQDHKQAYEGDQGPNTGGMGAYTPTPVITDKLMAEIERDILVPTVDALRRDGVIFQGILYAGLMLTAGGPKVLEFNCRFGDPETQPLMMRLKGDLVQIMIATVKGELHKVQIDWDKRHCCCVVMASQGYPGDYPQGLPITGIKEAQKQGQGDIQVFHAGTKRDKSNTLLTAGGRVLSVCAMGDTLKQAQEKANAACETIHFEGAFYRKDIGCRVM